MEIITNGWDRKCRDSLGGIHKLYIFPYVKFIRSQIVTNGNILVSFPDTLIYEFYANGNPTANENQTENEGGKYYEQNLSFQFQYGIENIEKLINKDYRVIVLDRNGIYRIYGLYNGLESGNLDYNTGGAKIDMNGYSIGFNGKEENGSFFITDLEDAGFSLTASFRITEDGELRELQNGDLRILQQFI